MNEIKKTKNQKKTRSLKGDRKTIPGKIHVHPKGFGFVTAEDIQAHPKDIFIPKHLKGGAVDGDLVEITIRLGRRPEKGPEGAVENILKRGRERIVGIVWLIDPSGKCVLYLPSFGTQKAAILAKKQEECYQVGDRLLLQIENWGEERQPLICKAVQKIGSVEEASTDTAMAIADFELPTNFPKEVIDQSKKFSRKVLDSDLEGRVDLTSLETITIDPDTAKDFDDALSLTQDPKGNYQIGIHIADVTHYVTPNSPIDEEAKKRSNSVYFPSFCIPMLPEHLSNHLCSLVEGHIRLTVSVLVECNPSGDVLHYQIVRSFIKSRKRYTYQQAKQILDGTLSSPYKPLLDLLTKMALLLKKKRKQRGSIDLALPEISPLIGDDGVPYAYTLIEYDITHQIVEEFMLLANYLVAMHVEKKEGKGIFRTHEAPDEESLEEFFFFVRALGFSLPSQPTIQDLQKMFDLSKETPYSQQLAVGFIRNMKLAIYSSTNSGHYGLALDCYSHFTSPIRRYSDLILHRILFREIEKESDLEAIARRCSEQERRTAKAEIYVHTMKKLRWFDRRQKEDPTAYYLGTITKVKPFGIYFDVAPLSIEGFIHVAELRLDYYEYIQERKCLVGQKSGDSFLIGNQIQVKIVHVDLVTMEVTWELVS